jgi:hypothetical protein
MESQQSLRFAYSTTSKRQAFGISELRFLSEIRCDISSLWEKVLKVENFGCFNIYENVYDISVDSEIDSLLNCLSKSAFYFTSKYHKLCRKGFLCDYIAPFWSVDSLRQSIIPTVSFVPRVIKLISLLYKENAIRWIDTNDESKQIAYDILIRDGFIHKAYKSILRQLKLHNWLLVRPVTRQFDGRVKFSYDIIAPESFRVQLDDSGNLEKVLLSSKIVVSNNGVDLLQNCVVVWTNEYHYILDVNGKQINNPENSENKNPYGFIPFVLLTLDEAASLYDGGNDDLIESNIIANYYQLLVNQDATFSAINVFIHHNLGLQSNEVLSPMVARGLNDIRQGEGFPIPPDGKFVSGNPHFSDLNSLVVSTEKLAAIRQGISPAMLSDNISEVSGKALKAYLYELLETRKDDSEIMDSNERRVYSITARVVNVDRRINKYNAITTDLVEDSNRFYVDFGEISFEEDAQVEYALAKQKTIDGILSYYDFVRMYNTDVSEEAEIDKMLAKNQLILNRVKSSGFRKALIDLNLKDESTTDE